MTFTRLVRSLFGLAALSVIAAALVFAVPAAAADFVPGSPGLGDPFFPIRRKRRLRRLALFADARLRAVVQPALGHGRDHRDGDAEPRQLRPRPARLLDLAPARQRSGGVVHAKRRARARDHAGRRAAIGLVFTVVIDYAGTPRVVTDPDGAIEGWIPTDDGAFVVGEPQGSPAWYPVNDNPRDKATFDFSITVPDGLTAMANGVLRLERDRRRQDDLGLAGNGSNGPLPRHRDARSVRPDGLDDVGRDSDLRGRRPAALEGAGARQAPRGRGLLHARSTARIPFNAVGAIVDSAKVVGYSLETQTKPVFDRMPDEATLVHELSHMWFGDSVTLTTWPDIWLHEGFATWSEWIWSEYQGNKSAAQWFKGLYNTPAQDHPILDAARGRSRLARLPLQRHRLLPRRDDLAGAAREDRRHRRSSGCCGTGRRRIGTATSRPRSSSPSPSRRAAWISSTSSTSGCTSPTSPPPGRSRSQGSPCAVRWRGVLERR